MHCIYNIKFKNIVTNHFHDSIPKFVPRLEKSVMTASPRSLSHICWSVTDSNQEHSRQFTGVIASYYKWFRNHTHTHTQSYNPKKCQVMIIIC